ADAMCVGQRYVEAHPPQTFRVRSRWWVRQVTVMSGLPAGLIRPFVTVRWLPATTSPRRTIDETSAFIVRIGHDVLGRPAAQRRFDAIVNLITEVLVEVLGKVASHPGPDPPSQLGTTLPPLCRLDDQVFAAHRPICREHHRDHDHTER